MFGPKVANKEHDDRSSLVRIESKERSNADSKPARSGAWVLGRLKMPARFVSELG